MKAWTFGSPDPGLQPFNSHAFIQRVIHLQGEGWPLRKDGVDVA